jgi:hypothetical protein
MTVDLMILLIAAAFVGGSLAFALLWPYGLLMAVLGAPCGGSFFALIAGLLLLGSRARAKRKLNRSVDLPAEGPTAAV